MKNGAVIKVTRVSFQEMKAMATTTDTIITKFVKTEITPSVKSSPSEATSLVTRVTIRPVGVLLKNCIGSRCTCWVKASRT
ncbi:hypothetical protein D3C87_1759800 [compost metagenome]